MPNLTNYVHYACGFVDFEGKKADDVPRLLADFVDFVESYNKISKYYLIAHTETEILHIHFIFYSFAQVQLYTYFNKMRSYFVDKKKYCRNEGGISIEKCESINAHLLYMIHQDKKSMLAEKKQYSIDDFVSNDDVENIDTMMHSKKGVIDAYYLRDAVLDCITDFELMVKLTLPVYHRYKSEIETLRSMRPLLVQMRNEERQERLNNQLPF